MTAKHDSPATMEDLRDDLAKVKEDISSLAGAVAQRSKDAVRHMGQSVKGKMDSGVEAVESFVEHRPMTSVAIAFGAGVLTALLLRRK